MDEPTDRALKLQRLSREEYDSLETPAKAIVAGRSRRLVELSNITLAAELLNAVIDADVSSRTYIKEALEGKHPDFDEKVRGILREYLDSGVETGIRDYYKIKYAGGGIAPSAPTSQPQQKPKAEQTAAKDAGKMIGVDFKKKPQQAAETATPAPQPVSGAQPTQEDRRRRDIAVILSRWEKRSVEVVMRTESDVIDAVMSVADENSGLGLTDETVCKACEMIIESKTGVQFYMEALLPQHRAGLLERAKTAVKLD